MTPYRSHYISLKVSLKVQFWIRYCILYTLLQATSNELPFLCRWLTNSTNDADRGKTSMEACVRHIDLWMVHNRLKLNRDKMEVLVFTACYRPRPNIGNLTIVDEVVNCSSTAKDNGVTLDNGSLNGSSHNSGVYICRLFFTWSA